MFKRLRNRIIIITMAVTTAILVLSGVLIMVFSSTTRPEPKPEPDFSIPNPALYDDQELKDFIKNDRKEGSERLLATLLYVGTIIEVATFLIVYFASQKIVEPVRDSSDNKTINLPKQDFLQVLDILLDNATKYGIAKQIIKNEHEPM